MRNIIRRADPGDAGPIDRVLKDVWNQSIEREVFREHLASADCGIWVATVEGNVAGFVSAFVTPGRQGERRWEIDLVAVRRDDQGKGLGKGLLKQASEGGRSRTLDNSRAFVRTENVQSQSIFEAAGYQSDRRVHLLHLWEPESFEGSGRAQPEVKLIPVDTLTYRGLWIEGLSTVSEDSQETALKIARNKVHLESRINTGAFVPAEEILKLSDRVRQVGVVHGEYHCWVRK
jgi:ribosomal protein S18 acetylase RimI-like enzyme